jgi:WD40 repeat protein
MSDRIDIGTARWETARSSARKGGNHLSFDAFISYSHAADGRLAPALQRSIQRLAKPWYRPRALRVFRDESALSANPRLWSSIQTALDEAEWFVLLASPQAVASEWVSRELDHWLSTKSPDRVLVVVTDGTLEWDPGTQALTGTAVAEALRHAFREEPRHVDLRWAASETDLDVHNARFRDVVAQLAAPMHGIAKDELDSEDVRQHRRARRLARGGVSILLVLVVVSLVFGTFAALERNRANQQSVVTNANRLAALSSADAANNESLALLLGVEGFRRHDSTTTRSALLGSLTQTPQLVGFMPGPADAAAGAISPDGKVVVTGNDAGSLRFWHPGREATQTQVVAAPRALSSDAVVAMTFDRAGNDLDVLYFDGRVQRWNVAREAPVGSPLPIGRTSAETLAVSPDGTRIAVSGFGQAVEVWDVAARRVVARLAPPEEGIGGSTSASLGGNNSVAFSPDGKTLFTSGSKGLLTFDAATLRQIGAPLMTYSGSDGNIATATDSIGHTLVVTGVGQPSAITPAQQAATAPAPVGPASDPLYRSTYSFGATPTAGSANGATVFDATTREAIGNVGDATAYTDVALSHTGDFVVLGGTDGSLTISSLVEKEKLAPTLRGQGAEIEHVGLDRDDQRILSTAANGTTALWDFSGPGTLAFDASPATLTYPNRPGVPRRAQASYTLSRTDSFLPGSNLARYFLATVGGTGTPVTKQVETVDISTGQRLGLLRTAAAAPRLIAPHRSAPIFEVVGAAGVEQYAVEPVLGIVDFQGRYAATTSDFGDVLLWNARTGSPVGDPIIALGPTATALAFSSDGRELAVGRSNGTITRYAVPSLEQIGNPVIGQTSPISQLAYQPGGTLLASASGDSTKLIDLSTDQTVAVIPFVTDEAFNPDGTDSPAPNVVQFSPSGDELLTSGISNIGPATMLLWSMRPADWVRAACQAAGRNLSRAEWDKLIGTSSPYRRTCPQWPAGT